MNAARARSPEELAGMDAAEIREHLARYCARWGFDSYAERLIGRMRAEFAMPRSALTGGLRDDLRPLR